MKKVFVGVLFLFGLISIGNLNAQCKSSKQVKSYVSSHDDIVDIAISSDVHTTLVAAVKAADLVSTLKSDGPFTVFAPTNLAFEKLPKGTVESLLKPSAKSDLTSVLTYHVIPANISSSALVTAIQAAGGTFEMKTVQGGIIKATMKGNHVVLVDEKDRISKITATDLNGTNGVIHVVDEVVLPN